MVIRAEVGLKDASLDTRGARVLKQLKDDLGIASVSSVYTVSAYTIDEELRESELKSLCENVFCDSVVEKYSYAVPLVQDAAFSFAIEIGFRPGATDNVGTTSKEAIEDVLGRKLKGNAYSSSQYYFYGSISAAEAETIATKLLSNPLIERHTIIEGKEWDEERGFPLAVPKVSLKHEPKAEEVEVLDANEHELQKLSDERCLALSSEEWNAIKKYYSRKEVQKKRKEAGLPTNPTDVEIECIAQTWSEHCKHKIFNAKITYEENGKKEEIDSLFDTYIKGATLEIGTRVNWLVSVFSDNAGIIKFNSDHNVAFKVETHNAPSALDPYGGALTGIVGVNRDILGAGIGARFIFNTDVFCFAPPNFEGKLPKGVLHPKRIFEGVRRGVEHGGNKTGVPTVNGCILFDERYLGRPLVYCGTGGIIPRQVAGRPSEKKDIKDGYLAVMVGGRIGKDGIHGATFSSMQLDEHAPATAVQIGDPITQRKMYDFLLEARDKGFYSAITDNGAGGLSSSIGEMARLCGGCEIELEKAPLKYPGLDPWEILLSEAQERMSVAVEPSKISGFLQLARERSTEASVIGKFTSSGFFHAKYEGKTVSLLEMEFLHRGVPQMKLNARWEKKEKRRAEFPQPERLDASLISLLSSYNICSKEYVVRQYDHEVGGGSCVKPLSGARNDGPSDAGVVRPILSSQEGLVIANGICPKYSEFDAYNMASCAFDEAVRNAVCTGADPSRIAILDNFCWPDPIESEKTPDAKYKLAQLVRACKALYDCSLAYSAPCISGKDSMKNDLQLAPEKKEGKLQKNVFWSGKRKISIPPTLLFSALGYIADVSKATTIDFKREGESIYLIGATKDELGGSEYFRLHGISGGKAPKVNAREFAENYRRLHKAISARLISSAHDCSDGGLAVALAECAFAGDIGAEIDLRQAPYEGERRDDFILFSESAGRIIASVKKGREKEFESIMKGSAFARIGQTKGKQSLKIIGIEGREIISAGLEELKEAWKKPLNW